jgi:hypothetical protein
MQLWFQDDDLRSVRGPKSLDKLPKKERNAWK